MDVLMVNWEMAVFDATLQVWTTRTPKKPRRVVPPPPPRCDPRPLRMRFIDDPPYTGIEMTYE